MSATTPLPWGRARGEVGRGGSGRQQLVSLQGQKSSSPGFQGGGDGRCEKGGNTDNQNPAAENQAGAKPRENALPGRERISERLRDFLMRQRRSLRNMYGKTETELNESLEAPIKRGEEMARKLIMEMECPGEVVEELIVLTLYNVAILIGMFWCKDVLITTCFAYI